MRIGQNKIPRTYRRKGFFWESGREGEKKTFRRRREAGRRVAQGAFAFSVGTRFWLAGFTWPCFQTGVADDSETA